LAGFDENSMTRFRAPQKVCRRRRDGQIHVAMLTAPPQRCGMTGEQARL
jgi:hypothetical protein